ncbi:hypothetical protein ACFLRF_04930 [Candidatus Altiarchaeota archaeon]
MAIKQADHRIIAVGTPDAQERQDLAGFLKKGLPAQKLTPESYVDTLDRVTEDYHPEDPQYKGPKFYNSKVLDGTSPALSRAQMRLLAGRLRANIGWKYSQAGDYDKADEQLSRASDILNSLGVENDSQGRPLVTNTPDGDQDKDTMNQVLMGTTRHWFINGVRKGESPQRLTTISSGAAYAINIEDESKSHQLQAVTYDTQGTRVFNAIGSGQDAYIVRTAADEYGKGRAEIGKARALNTLPLSSENTLTQLTANLATAFSMDGKDAEAVPLMAQAVEREASKKEIVSGRPMPAADKNKSLALYINAGLVFAKAQHKGLDAGGPARYDEMAEDALINAEAILEAKVAGMQMNVGDRQHKYYSKLIGERKAFLADKGIEVKAGADLHSFNPIAGSKEVK